MYQRINDRKKAGLLVKGIICVIVGVYTVVNGELIREERSCFVKIISKQICLAILLTGMIVASDGWFYGRISWSHENVPKEEWICKARKGKDNKANNASDDSGTFIATEGF
jgi:hypothetical protein